MAIIAIEKTDLIGAEQLKMFLERRMANVSGMMHRKNLKKKLIGNALLAAHTADAYVCSEAYADAKVVFLQLLKQHVA